MILTYSLGQQCNVLRPYMFRFTRTRHAMSLQSSFMFSGRNALRPYINHWLEWWL